MNGCFFFFSVNPFQTNVQDAFSFISNNLILLISLKLAKKKEKLRYTLTLKLCCLKMIHCLYTPYHLKTIRHILENAQKISVSILKTIYDQLKNGSHSYDINRPMSRHGYKYTKYKKCLSKKALIAKRRVHFFNPLP